MDHVATMLEAQLERTPHATALIDDERRLTYRELHERANDVARTLVGLGVKRETRVGVCCERGYEMVIAIVAIGKAGGVYVPIDPEYPPTRRDFVIADAALEVVVTQRRLASNFIITTVCVDEAGTAPAPPPQERCDGDGMFVLYTSGSTGTPKGVVCTHAAVASRVRWQQDAFPFAPGEIASARTTLGFVDSVAEIFAPLAFGVPLLVIGGAAQKDPGLAISKLAAAAASRIVLVPSLLATMLDVIPDLAQRSRSLHYWFVGGEPIPVPLVERFQRELPGRKLINIYGATELTADATFYDFDAMPPGLATSPIGRPLPGVYARVVDGSLREVAAGDPGEIVISGSCLARGYLGLPALTAERFVANPFPEGGQLYRTRDLGRLLPTGDLQYLGRLDQLVKVRGFRVELGEVEAVVGAVPGVSHAAAIARDDQLIAFYVADRELPVTDLRGFVAARVPTASVPNRFVRLERFPINTNGKVDRAALALVPIVIATTGPGPASDDEHRVAAVWREILGLGEIGRDQDFFELGGTSLAAMRVVARIRDRHGVDLPVAALFEAPTIAALARRLVSVRPAPARPPITIGKRPLPASLRLSHYQYAFWLVRALTGDISMVADVFAFAERVDVARLQDAWSRTVAAFDSLWMRYPRWRPVQAIAPRRPVAFDIATTDDIVAEAERNITRPFDLDSPPHVRATLVRTRDGDRLAIAIPHVAVDMAAMEILRKTLETTYAGGAPPRCDTNVHDLVEWERTLDEGHGGDDDVRYWAQITRGSTANPVPTRMFARGRVRAWSTRPIDGGRVQQIAEYARSRSLSLPLALCGAIHAGLARATGLDAPTSLVFIDKRDRAELQDLFTTLSGIMPLRVDGARGPVGEVVGRVARQLVASAEHSDHLMRRPTMWNDFWLRAPYAARTLVGLLPPLAGEYVRALVPVFERKHGRLMFMINILPEVTQPTSGMHITRRRGLPEMLLPSAMITGADVMLDRVLQVHVTNAGGFAVNLYGGGLTQAALDEVNDHIVAALAALP